MLQSEQNYKSFLNLSVKEYPNKWVALIDGHVVAVKNTFKEVYVETKQKFPQQRPLIAKIPSKRAMIL